MFGLLPYGNSLETSEEELKALIVHCHPNAQSFNAAMTKVAGAALLKVRAEVSILDLYAEKFDPVEHECHYEDRVDPNVFVPLAEQRHAYERGVLSDSVRLSIEKLDWADLVILQFPLWWHAQPAILKGWFDRVFVSGLYTSRKRYDTGHFCGKRAICSVTSGAPASAFGPYSRGGDFDTMLWPIQYSLHYMGFSVLAPMLSFGVQGTGFSYQDENSLQVHLEGLLDTWGKRVPGLMDEKFLTFPGWSDWDDEGRAQRTVS